MPSAICSVMLMRSAARTPSAPPICATSQAYGQPLRRIARPNLEHARARTRPLLRDASGAAALRPCARQSERVDSTVLACIAPAAPRDCSVTSTRLIQHRPSGPYARAAPRPPERPAGPARHGTAAPAAARGRGAPRRPGGSGRRTAAARAWPCSSCARGSGRRSPARLAGRAQRVRPALLHSSVEGPDNLQTDIKNLSTDAHEQFIHVA
jgi:hypothetical protein